MLFRSSFSNAGEPLRPVRWETAPTDGGTQVTITVTIPSSEDIARTCAGWEAHLAMLEAVLKGAPIPFPFETFKNAREAYKAKAAALG